VICTLGNFATKLLSGSSAGITRVHGQPRLRELGGRMVRLYPLFHPAAALRTPRVKEQLREDFARLPVLLAEGPPAQPGENMVGATESPARTDPGRAGPEPARAEPVDQLGFFG